MKTVIQTSTGKVLRAQMHDIIGDDEMLIDDLLTVPMIDPYYINGQFVDMATAEEIEEANRPPVPLEVSLWKLKFVLQQMGLEQSVIDAINQLPDPPKTAALYLWNGGPAVDRHSPTIELIKQSIGLNERQVDDIFIQANLITL